MRAALGAIALLVSGVAVGAVASAPESPLRDVRGEKERAVEELAQSLKARESALDRRETSIADREGQLKEVETRLDDRLKELQAMRDEIDKIRADLEARDQAQMTALVSMVEKMRGSEAGPIVAALEDELAIEVLRRMSSMRAAKVMAAIPTERAAVLAAGLSPMKPANP